MIKENNYKESFFSIQNLLSEQDNGNVSGPMSPFLFAKEMCCHFQIKFNRLARVWFNDEKIHQIMEQGEGLTGHDTLIIGCQYANDLWLSLWIDSGIGGIPTAAGFQSERQAALTPIYINSEFERKLTTEEVQQIFDFVFDNPHLIEIEKSNKG